MGRYFSGEKSCSHAASGKEVWRRSPPSYGRSEPIIDISTTERIKKGSTMSFVQNSPCFWKMQRGFAMIGCKLLVYLGLLSAAAGKSAVKRLELPDQAL